MKSLFRHTVSLFFVATALWGCSLVDEDMTDCDSECTIDYELRLITNMSTELQTELSTTTDAQTVTALRDYLKDVFTDYAHDVDLSFYDVERDPQAQDSVLLHHESHIMDANQSSYTLYIPVRRYYHLAVANIEKNTLVSHENGNLCHKARLNLPSAPDTLPAHRTGLFTARLPMDIVEGQDQEFHVRLYMANCASALVIDTTDRHVLDMKAYAQGFANSFSICDSTFRFDRKYVVQADNLTVPASSKVSCFATVNYPTKDIGTRTVIDVDDPDVQPSGDVIWAYSVYVKLSDGTTTESVLKVYKPLRAGHLKILKAKLLDNGAVQPDDPSVGVSVRLDWTPGNEYNPEF